MSDETQGGGSDGHDEKDVAMRLAILERRIKAREDIADRVIRSEVARAVQSVGIVVDYLADHGLVDKADLTAYIEERFLVMGSPTADEPRMQAIDVYGWLTWAELSASWRAECRRRPSTLTASASGAGG